MFQNSGGKIIQEGLEEKKLIKKKIPNCLGNIQL